MKKRTIFNPSISSKYNVYHSYGVKQTFYAWLVLGIVFCNQAVFAQSPVTIPNSVEVSLHSKVNNVQYNLQIALPHGYGKSTADYPVVYVLDANTDFPLVTSISRRLEAEDDLKKLVVVGISYQDSVWWRRSLDYSPSTREGERYTGGAQNFIRSLEEEIIPTIEKEFRVKKNGRTLMGHSLGGLFASYLVVNNNDLFDNYVVSSPSMWWDNYVVLKSSSPTYTPKSIFLTVGAEENPHMIKSCHALSDFIDKKLTASTKKAVELSGENHASAKFRAFADGLRWLFKESE